MLLLSVALAQTAPPIVNGSTTGSTGRDGGCVLVADGANVTVLDSTIEQCVAERDGGGVHVAFGAVSRASRVLIERCDLRRNFAGR